MFQKRMNKILSGLEGALCLIDDILVFAKDEEEHTLSSSPAHKTSRHHTKF